MGQKERQNSLSIVKDDGTGDMREERHSLSVASLGGHEIPPISGRDDPALCQQQHLGSGPHA